MSAVNRIKRIIRWLLKRWLWVSLWLFLFIPIISFVLVNVVLLTLYYWPPDVDDIDYRQFISRQPRAILMAHGATGDTKAWVDPLAEIYRQQGVDAQLMPIDWSQYAKNPYLCATKGTAIGERIGQQLAQSQFLESVHLIGHSCGGFVIYNACLELKKQKPTVLVQTTYLDPVSIYGAERYFGVEHFGDCADYSDAYVDTEDQVVGSNQALVHAQTYDVTEERRAQGYTGLPHNWPTVFYQQAVKQQALTTLFDDPSLVDKEPEENLIPLRLQK